MADPSFVPISPNPYIVGNPVRGRAMFFGRDAEFQLIRKRFEHADHGGLLVFCGERRSGKTSILFQILDRRLGDSFIPVLIDMQSMAVASEAEFLDRVSAEILTALGTGAGSPVSPDFSGAASRSDVFRRFVGDCLRAHPARKLILLFDEYELFENKIDAGQISEDVLNILGGLMEHASVFMVFTGSQHLEQRRRDYWGLLGKSLWKTVSYLEEGDARALVREPVTGRLTYDDDAVTALLRLAAGQPFYTQALCQQLVDQCNERQTAQATAALVGDVVTALVDNPLPQMIFMWDGFERDDKLALALLAEALESDAAFASVDDVLKHLKRRGYPVELDRARVATALEKLFKSELLLRDDRGGAPAYAYRMDLWRLWVRRQHSVWQVLREEGLATRRTRRPVWRYAGPAIGVAGTVVLAFTLLRKPAPATPTGATFAAGAGYLALGVRPEETLVRMDGRRAGVGPFRDSIAADVDHRLELSAAGHADTTVTARVARGGRLGLMVALRPLLGDLAIDTKPPGAEVRVDGRVAGRSPVTVRGLGTAGTHRVEAALDGYGVARADAAVRANATTPLALTLETGRTDVVVTSEPNASRLRVDGVERGTTPVTLQALPLGRHVFNAAHDGSVAIETTIVVTAATRQLALALPREAPGTLVVLGDLPAQIYVDGALVVENVQNSGPRTVSPGAHALRVVLVSGETLDQRVTVHSGERVSWDFSKNDVTRRTEGGR